MLSRTPAAAFGSVRSPRRFRRALALLVCFGGVAAGACTDSSVDSGSVESGACAYNQSAEAQAACAFLHDDAFLALARTSEPVFERNLTSTGDVQLVRWDTPSGARFGVFRKPGGHHPLEELKLGPMFFQLDRLMELCVAPAELLVPADAATQTADTTMPYPSLGPGTIQKYLGDDAQFPSLNADLSPFKNASMSSVGQRVALFHHAIGIRDGAAGSDWMSGDAWPDYNNTALLPSLGWIAAYDNLFVHLNDQEPTSTYFDDHTVPRSMMLEPEVEAAVDATLQQLRQTPDAFRSRVFEPASQLRFGGFQFKPARELENIFRDKLEQIRDAGYRFSYRAP